MNSMTDRINYLTVVLTKDTRDDDTQPLVDAIKQMKNVLSVEMNIANQDDYSARQVIKAELVGKIWETLK